MAIAVKRAVALLSSGLDSTVATVLSHRYDMDIALALTFDYGQRAAKRETERAGKIAAWLGIPHETIALPFFSTLPKGGALLDRAAALPHPSRHDIYSQGRSIETAKAVWTPNRNGVFIEVAAAKAEAIGAEAIVVGFNAEEAQTFADNSIAYLSAITTALSFSTRNQVSVWAPTASLHKKEIIERAVDEKIPLELLWSCYEGAEKMCGRCESCMRLKCAMDAQSPKLFLESANALFIDASL